RRTGHAPRSRTGRRAHRLSEERRVGVHAPVAADPRRGLHRHDRVRSRRHSRSGTAVEATNRPRCRAAPIPGMRKEDIAMGTRLAVVVIALLLALAGAGDLGAQKGTIKVGLLAPMTGGAAQIGKDMVNGFTMYLEEHGTQFAGRKVEVLVED